MKPRRGPLAPDRRSGDTDPQVSEELREQLEDLLIARTIPELAGRLVPLIEIFWRDIVHYAVDNGHRLEILKRQQRKMWALIAFGFAIIGVAIVVVVHAENRTAERNLARENRVAARNLKVAVQRSRYSGSLTSCERSNKRNAEVLRLAPSALPLATTQHRAQILALLDAAVPVHGDPLILGDQTRACKAYAHQQVRLPAG